jgi:threonine dehydrogenase-like Zn-dependent dehydrogenase
VLGTAQWPGALGELIVAPESVVYHVPDHLTDDQATVIEPLGVAVHSVRRANLKAGESALILGAGSIGHVTAAMCQVREAASIIAVDVKPHCLDSVLRVGATHTIRADQEPVVERVLDATGGKGVDVVFLTSHAPETFGIAMDTVRRQGRIVVIALFEHPVSIHPYDVIKKDMGIVGSIMSNDEDVQEAIALIASGRVCPELILTHHLPIAEAQRGFELTASKEEGAIKVALQFES